MPRDRRAAQAFQDPLWRGIAWYRAGEFEKAATSFALRDTAEAHYNQGNARLMLGKYDDAIAGYDRALATRPDWKEALENRALAAARARMVVFMNVLCQKSNASRPIRSNRTSCRD